MGALRQKDQLDATIRWIAGAIRSGNAISIEQAETWLGALTVLRQDIVRRELAIITAEARIDDSGAGRIIDTLYAETLVIKASKVIRTLCEMALVSADKAETIAIEFSARQLIDTLDALARGIVRPEGVDPEQTQEGA